MKDERLFTISEIAKLTGIPRVTLYQRIKRGVYPTVEKDGQIYLSEPVVRTLERERNGEQK